LICFCFNQSAHKFYVQICVFVKGMFILPKRVTAPLMTKLRFRSCSVVSVSFAVFCVPITCLVEASDTQTFPYYRIKQNLRNLQGYAALGTSSYHILLFLYFANEWQTKIQGTVVALLFLFERFGTRVQTGDWLSWLVCGSSLQSLQEIASISTHIAISHPVFWICFS